MIQIGLDKHAMKTLKMLQAMGPAVRREMNYMLGALGEDLRERLIGSIVSGQLELAPLTPGYASYKAARFGDMPILVKTTGYINSIVVLRAGMSKGSAVNTRGTVHGVGIKPGARSKSGVPYEKVAAELEYGNSRSPARPHWRLQVPWVSQEIVRRGKHVLQRALDVSRAGR